jgi:hypothetical protein
MRTPSMSQNASILVPAPTLTPVPKRTLGPIVTSAASFVSAASQTESGSVMLTPPAIAAARRRLCSAFSATASSARELTPWNSASSPSTARATWPSALAMATASVR